MIHYRLGDATEPENKPAIICHVCNDIGAWGAGFVLALSKKSKKPETAYKNWHKQKKIIDMEFKLGHTQMSLFTPGVMVANMIAQEGIKNQNGVPPLRYDALEKALRGVYDFAKQFNFTVCMPRIGCDLAGGEWGEVEKIIKKVNTVETFVYTLPEQKDKWKEIYENS